jgi:hypothetical protein
MSRLVPIVVLLSWVPDIGLGASHGEPHTTWGEVAVLMIMHVVVSVIGVTFFARLLPLSRARTAAAPMHAETVSQPRSRRRPSDEGASPARGSPLTESNRRPSPYHG